MGKLSDSARFRARRRIPKCSRADRRERPGRALFRETAPPKVRATTRFAVPLTLLTGLLPPWTDVATFSRTRPSA